MKVARYEVPGKMQNQPRPIGNGMIGTTETFFCPGQTIHPLAGSHRALRDGSFFTRSRQ
jgi:hypothetical protein